MKVVLDWPVPKLVKEVQKFLRLANCYRRFIKDFTKIVRLLYKGHYGTDFSGSRFI